MEILAPCASRSYTIGVTMIVVAVMKRALKFGVVRMHELNEMFQN